MSSVTASSRQTASWRRIPQAPSSNISPEGGSTTAPRAAQGPRAAPAVGKDAEVVFCACATSMTGSGHA